MPRADFDISSLEGDETGMWMTCKLCGAVSKKYHSNAVVGWLRRHVIKEHPEVGWK